MPSPYDLTNIADLKAWLDIAGTDDDTLLAGLITDLSRAILAHLDRAGLLPCTYLDLFDGGNETSVMLQHWPVNAVLSCVVDGKSIAAAPPLIEGTALRHGYVLDLVAPPPPGRMQRLSLRHSRFVAGVQNVSVTYSAGYQVAAEAAVVPLSEPFTLAARAPYGSWANDGGVAYVAGMALTPTDGTPSAGQYAVAGGAYTFAAADAGAAVLLTYGYVPADLARCCLEWAAERYAYRGRIGQRSKSLGGQESVGFIVKDIPDFVATALQPYRRVVSA